MTSLSIAVESQTFTPESLSVHPWVSTSNCLPTPLKQLAVVQLYFEAVSLKRDFPTQTSNTIRQPSNHKVHTLTFWLRLFFLLVFPFLALSEKLSRSQDPLAGSLFLLPQMTFLAFDQQCLQSRQLRQRLGRYCQDSRMCWDTTVRTSQKETGQG